VHTETPLADDVALGAEAQVEQRYFVFLSKYTFDNHQMIEEVGIKMRMGQSDTVDVCAARMLYQRWTRSAVAYRHKRNLDYCTLNATVAAGK
jgi:hypothetical protein